MVSENVEVKHRFKEMWKSSSRSEIFTIVGRSSKSVFKHLRGAV